MTMLIFCTTLCILYNVFYYIYNIHYKEIKTYYKHALEMKYDYIYSDNKIVNIVVNNILKNKNFLNLFVKLTIFNLILSTLITILYNIFIKI